MRLAGSPTVESIWEAALAAGLAGRSEVVFTGFGEPTRRLDAVLELTRRLKTAGIRRVRVDTDGLASLRGGVDVPPLLAAAGVDAISVSLNAADAATYARLCPNRHGEAAYQAVKDFIRSAVRCLPDVAASVVGMDGLVEADCRAVAEGLGARFKWRPYDRIGRIEAAGAPPSA